MKDFIASAGQQIQSPGPKEVALAAAQAAELSTNSPTGPGQRNKLFIGDEEWQKYFASSRQLF